MRLPSAIGVLADVCKTSSVQYIGQFQSGAPAPVRNNSNIVKRAFLLLPLDALGVPGTALYSCTPSALQQYQPSEVKGHAAKPRRTHSSFSTFRTICKDIPTVKIQQEIATRYGCSDSTLSSPHKENDQ